MKHTPEQQDDVRPVMDHLTQSSLGKIIQKAKWLLTLDRVFKTILPETFLPYCHVMNVDQSILIVGVTNAAIATRIRFMSGDFIRELQKQKEFAHIQTIHCRVCAEGVRIT
ncbi:MAG: hypothetical protein A3C44_03780 [Gammaproteobacteria bacterium RIFCSPHIGHO2_02_FULL_39_13]|nr:MAG: hypothetical protein A3C44_03780 [Gammaproteobacteria bacterium RIFCSPHIGHO2_02_FULL_39_13]OGT50260.1 MAG: hypothetical protein A3E53_00705 [Gammaproteobacteria bacterium RIFCSPHIGHO2_12_FULL_39_24]